jgi:nucleoside-diphosphate-sugar epimerase
MRIAVLGANSQIAADYIRLNQSNSKYAFTAFVRPESISASSRLFNNNVRLSTYDEPCSNEIFDVIVNCVGVGDPARARGLQSTIVEISERFDAVALEMTARNSSAKYVFLSSGVAYGHDFESPVTALSSPKNSFDPAKLGDQYGLAKFQIEQRHRLTKEMGIYDLRIFGYFNRTMNIEHEFLLLKIARAILQKETFVTSADSIFRDYSNAIDFSHMLDAIIKSPPMNTALDLYSQSPVEKFLLLESLSERFNLRYEIDTVESYVSPTGTKPKYFSENHAASSLGFKPSRTALENVHLELEQLISTNGGLLQVT